MHRGAQLDPIGADAGVLKRVNAPDAARRSLFLDRIRATRERGEK
jgi:hypothetical protein